MEPKHTQVARSRFGPSASAVQDKSHVEPRFGVYQRRNGPVSRDMEADEANRIY